MRSIEIIKYQMLQLRHICRSAAANVNITCHNQRRIYSIQFDSTQFNHVFYQKLNGNIELSQCDVPEFKYLMYRMVLQQIAIAIPWSRIKNQITSKHAKQLPYTLLSSCLIGGALLSYLHAIPSISSSYVAQLKLLRESCSHALHTTYTNILKCDRI